MAAKLTQHRLDGLVRRSRLRIPIEERRSILDELVRAYRALPPGDETAAQRLRQVFLLALVELPPNSVDCAPYARFVAEHVRPEDFAHSHWKSTRQVIALYELLQSFEAAGAELVAPLQELIHHLLFQALDQFEQQGDLEKVFQLLQFAPFTDLVEDDRLRRLRSRAYVYEGRRVQSRRRVLYVYLAVYVLLVTLVLPLLFINAEDGHLQDQIEQGAASTCRRRSSALSATQTGVLVHHHPPLPSVTGMSPPKNTFGRVSPSALAGMGVLTLCGPAGANPGNDPPQKTWN